MKPLATVVALLVAGCATHHNPRLGGGGGGGGGGPGPDASVPDAAPVDGGVPLAGTLCALTDLRLPTSCGVIDLTGTVITERPSGDQTAAVGDGHFVLTVPGSVGSILEVGIGAPALHAAVVPVPPWTLGGSLTVPIVDATVFAELLGALGAVEPDGTASIVLYVTRAGLPLAGVEVTAPAGTVVAPYYDNGSALDWSQLGLTGDQGAALLVGVPIDSATALVGLTIDGQPSNLAAPVVAGALSFVRLDL